MGETEKHKYRFGLVGKGISYSFSKGYFTKKFQVLDLQDHSYENFDLDDLSQFKNVSEQKHLKGLNVTIPYKEEIIPYLHQLDSEAKMIGAVNTIKFTKDGLIGFNTDAFGFKESLYPLLKEHHKKALVLGTGGASKAITFVLEQLGIEYRYVSRTPSRDQLHYSQLHKSHFKEYQLIINCSPVGTHPNSDQKPQIPYAHLNETHILFDLIYNPPETAFLSEGKKRGATIKNGLSMLEFQAEKAWGIWDSP
ncbi:shikimate dehydrogenase [Flavobacteriaceae bacterium GF1]